MRFSPGLEPWLAEPNAVLFTVRGSAGQCPWCAVQDVTFRKNILGKTPGGVNISGTDDLGPSQQAARIVVRDNVLDDISWRNFQLLNMDSPDLQRPGGIRDLTIDHNTGRLTGPDPPHQKRPGAA